MSHKENKPTFLEKWKKNGGPVARLAKSRLVARILNVITKTGIDFGRDINAATEVIVRVDTAIRPQFAAAIGHKTAEIADAQTDADVKDANTLLAQTMGDVEDIELEPDPVPSLRDELAVLERLQNAAEKVSKHVDHMLIKAVRSDTGIAKCKEAYAKTLAPLSEPIEIDAAANLTEGTKAKVVAAIREEQAELIAATLEDILEIYIVAVGGAQTIDKQQREELEAAWAELPDEMPTIESVREALYGDHVKADLEAQALKDAADAEKAEKLADQKYAADNAKSRQGGQERPPEWSKDARDVSVA